MSKGSDLLFTIISKILPGRKIIKEHVVGGKLRLDFYIPDLKIGFEYDGRQHNEFVKHFHKTKEGYLESRMRDKIKAGICEDSSINLIRISCDDELTEEFIRTKIMEILR